MQAPENDQARAIKSAWAAYDALRFRESESWFSCLVHGSKAAPIEAVCGLSAVKRALGRPAEAKQLIESAREDHGDVPCLRRELGYIAYDQRRVTDTVEIFAGLATEFPRCVEYRRWQVVGLRKAGKYQDAEAVLTAAHEAGLDHHDLDIERGWVAYGRDDFQRAIGHFQRAQEHGAPVYLCVPPLVTALLRVDQLNTAEAVAEEAARHVGKKGARDLATEVADEAATYAPLNSPVACARADIQVHRGRPEEAISILYRLRHALDDQGLRQLVTLLIGADRDEDAVEVFDEWFRERCGDEDDALAFASPYIVATWIDVARRRKDPERGELGERIQSARSLYGGPDPVPAMVEASAICALRTVDKVKAMDIARESVARHPGEPDLLIESAKTSFKLRDYDKAIEEFDRAIELDPYQDRARQWRCRSMRRLGQWTQLEKRLNEEIKDHKQSARLYIELGWLLLVKADYSGAREAFSEAYRLDKSSQQALFGRITTLRSLQLWPEASADLAKWKKAWPRSNRYRLAEAMFALDCDDLGRAMPLFKKGDGVSDLLGQASVLTKQGRPYEAIATLEKARKKDPGRPGAAIALATLLLQRADGREQSNEKLRKLTKDDQDRASQLCLDVMGWGAESDAAALACRAHLAHHQGHQRAAESLLRDAIQRNPHCARITSALADVLIDMHRPDEAVKLLNKHIWKYGRQSSTQLQLYRALDVQGDSEGAIAALRTALGLASDREGDTLAVELAYELEQQGRPVEAERLLRDRLSTRDTAGDDLLRLGLAWILLSRGDKDRSPSRLQEAIAEATRVIEHPDQQSSAVNPRKVKEEALKCRGTAYYKLAEHELNPRDRILFARLARYDQGDKTAAKGQVPAGSRWFARMAAGLDTELRMLALIVAMALTAVLWSLHANNQAVWTTPMVMSLTPLFFAVILLAALLPQLHSLRLAGLEATTREPPDVPLPTSPGVVLPVVTEFAAVAYESFLDTVDVSDLVGNSSTLRLDPLARGPSPQMRGSD
jgi:tetratricopeptide (TPR) repeat protein